MNESIKALRTVASSNQKGLTFEQHDHIGVELFHFRERLLQLSSMLQATYGRKSPISDAAEQAIEHIDRLRYDLHCRVQIEHTRHDPGRNDRAYYRGPIEANVIQKQAEILRFCYQSLITGQEFPQADN